MISPKVVLLREVLEEHLDELQFLWQLRREAVRSPERTRSDVDRLDERVRAHADGLLVARGELGEIVGPLLSSDDPPAAFAAGVVLLRTGEEGARAVLDAFRAAGPGGREGLAEAFAFGEARGAREELASLAGADDPSLAVAAATALALGRGAAAPDATRLLGEADPVVRAAAWRLAPFQPRAPRPELLRRGLDDPDPAVAREAAVAAAWFRSPLALEASRERSAGAGESAGEWLRLLAVLAEEGDVAAVLAGSAKGTAAGRGAAGPRALGALGHPRGVELLLEAMGDDDPARAAAAGTAFRKVTGFDAAGEVRVSLRPDGPPPDEVEEEFLDEVTLPDAPQARAFWSSARGRFAGGGRWCYGVDVAAGVPAALPAAFDMESCFEARLRGRFTGTFTGDAGELVRMAP
ncbi:MAG: hypothetical protein ACYC4P_17445 [Thermoanaerobaculia bacterium]